MAYSMGAVLDGPEAPRALARARARDFRPGGPPDAGAPAAVGAAGRPWQGWALAAAAMVLALIPGFFWYRELSESRARQAATAALLAEEQRSSASLREAATRAGATHRVGPCPSSRWNWSAAEGPARRSSNWRFRVESTRWSWRCRPTWCARLRPPSSATPPGRRFGPPPPCPRARRIPRGLTVEGRLLSPGRYTVVLLAGIERWRACRSR